MAKLISKTYGDALFELALEEKKTNLFLEEISVLIGILKENPEFEHFMNHPKIPKEEKLQVLENVFKGKVAQEIVGFLVTIVEKDRYSEIDEILAYVVMRIKEYSGIGVAYVTTAIPLQEKEQKAVESRLLATTKYDKIECHYQIEQSLIGGMVIRIGDHVVDSSIRTKLEKLERELLQIQLA